MRVPERSPERSKPPGVSMLLTIRMYSNAHNDHVNVPVLFFAALEEDAPATDRCYDKVVHYEIPQLV
jgi:hypothetical protein